MAFAHLSLRESLRNIAGKNCSANNYPVIFEAIKHMLFDPNKIHLGRLIEHQRNKLITNRRSRAQKIRSFI
jgi:hypothetical protein